MWWQQELPPLTEEEAVREVGWIARRAREIVGTPIGDEDPADMVEFYARKVRLLRHIGTPDALANMERNELELEQWKQRAGGVR